MKYKSLRSARAGAISISLLLILGTLMPAESRASVLGGFVTAILGTPEKQHNTAGGGNLQIMPLPKPAMNANPMAGKGGGDIKIVDDNALMPEEGPSGTIADIEKPKNSAISTYIVREGDTLSEIAELFGVSTDTVLWANDLTRTSKIQIGQKLVILPVTSVRHTVKKGDTLASIAKRYHGDAVEIANYNGIVDEELVVGTEITIPDGEMPIPVSTKSSGSTGTASKGTATQIGYYMRPIAGGTRTQGIHGYNGVDIAAPVGTSILASAEGDVIVAKDGGWNGGYGSYVVIQHTNGSQTLYSHASRVLVSVGQRVTRGQIIGAVGATGKVTGPHVHFEIRNGIRNPF